MHKPILHKDWIDPTALRIVQVLQTSGFETFLVGGCVRDLLVGIFPKDFDIATNAQPDEVRKKIPYSFIIGRRFRLVLVKKGSSQFEIATFRRTKGPEDLLEEGVEPLSGDNLFGTAAEDAQRRDFTINSIFYDPISGKLIDFCEGLADIESRTLRMIGPAIERLIEDPIRILRAVRLSHKIGFRLEESLRAGIITTSAQLKTSILPRRREEYLKILKLDDPSRTLFEMYDLGILEHTLPSLHSLLGKPESAEIFRSYLNFINTQSKAKMEPRELFTYLVFAFIKAFSQNEVIDLEKINDDPQLQTFMKDELGMFKLETSDLIRTLEFMPQLKKIDSYMRKGARRKTAFLNHEFFSLSLKLGYLERTLSTPTYHFWLREAEAPA